MSGIRLLVIERTRGQASNPPWWPIVGCSVVSARSSQCRSTQKCLERSDFCCTVFSPSRARTDFLLDIVPPPPPVFVFFWALEFWCAKGSNCYFPGMVTIYGCLLPWVGVAGGLRPLLKRFCVLLPVRVGVCFFSAL